MSALLIGFLVQAAVQRKAGSTAAADATGATALVACEVRQTRAGRSR